MAKYADYITYQTSYGIDVFEGEQFSVSFELRGTKWNEYMFRRLRDHGLKFPSQPTTVELLQMILDFAETEIPAA